MLVFSIHNEFRDYASTATRDGQLRAVRTRIGMGARRCSFHIFRKRLESEKPCTF